MPGKLMLAPGRGKVCEETYKGGDRRAVGG